MTGAEFRQFREGLGLSQAKLAEELSVTDQAIWRWEKDRTPVSQVVQLALQRIAAFFPGGFDLRSAIEKLNDPFQIMNVWFIHEGRELPPDYSSQFFKGWGSFTPEEKFVACTEAKLLLDLSLEGLEAKK